MKTKRFYFSSNTELREGAEIERVMESWLLDTGLIEGDGEREFDKPTMERLSL